MPAGENSQDQNSPPGMLFNSRKDSFFLDLEKGSDQSAGVVLFPPDNTASEPSTSEQPADVSVVSVAPGADRVEPAPVSQPEKAAASVTTTAEAIAAQLAAEQAARPATPMATFAPDNLVPGAGLIQRRRRPGASMSGFRNLAGDLFKS